MKKVYTLVAAFLLCIATINQLNATPFQQKPATTQHLKKDGTPDKRFKENKTPKGPVTKSGKPDMRFKSNNPDAGKRKKSN